MSATPTPTDHATAPIEELHLHRILVAVDGSESAELALRAGITVAHRDRATLTLVSVAPDVVATAARWPTAMAMPVGSQEAVDARAREALDQAIARMPDDVSIRTVVRRGSAAHEILALAAEGDFDAIIVGARGVGKMGSLVGSVSQEILHRAGIPVFVAHAPAHEDRVPA